jgi:hypothetical protein
MQVIHVMPTPAAIKPAHFPQPYAVNILVINAVCMLLHLYLSSPSAGEATRGYLHGSLLLDFVGQRGPSSKLFLLMLDALIMTLQLIAFAAVVKRKEVLRRMSSTQANSPAGSNQVEPVAVAISDRDHDAEERGEHRRPPLPLDSLTPENSIGDLSDFEPGADIEEERHWLLQDLTASGQVVIAELFLWDDICKQYKAYTTHMHTPEFADTLRSNLLSELNIPFRS